MKIKVKDLQPNPFRKIEKYPVDQHKVDSLKASINQTEFWNNLLAREVGGKFQLAYGYHRLVALQQLKIEEINIPVKDIDDSQMIQIMANENALQWNLTPALINETVEIAKEYLDRELAKHESWEDLNKNIKILFDTEHSFIQTKTHGIGQTTILKFLGEPWKQYQIQQALKILNDEELSREAVEQFETNTDAQEFIKHIKNAGVPIEEQPELAKRAAQKKKDKNGKRETTGISETRDHFYDDVKEAAEETGHPEWFESDTAKAAEIERAIKNFNSKIKALRKSAVKLLHLLQEMKVKEIHGYAKGIILLDVTEMLQWLYKTLRRFGIDKYIKSKGGEKDEISIDNKESTKLLENDRESK